MQCNLLLSMKSGRNTNVPVIECFLLTAAKRLREAANSNDIDTGMNNVFLCSRLKQG